MTSNGSRRIQAKMIRKRNWKAMPDKNLIFKGKNQTQRVREWKLLEFGEGKSKGGENGWWVLCLRKMIAGPETSWKGKLGL